MDGKEKPTKKPDVDNIVKTVTDALSGVIYKDDKQITSLVVGKIYSVRPGVALVIKMLDN